MQVMHDVSLDKIVVDKDGKTCRLEFIDMQEGAAVGVIECRDVILMNYHNVMGLDGLATYIGQVEVDELSGDAGRAKLRELGFKFRDLHGYTSTSSSGTVHHLRIEGGEVCIDLCCGECRVWPSSLEGVD